MLVNLLLLHSIINALPYRRRLCWNETQLLVLNAYLCVGGKNRRALLVSAHIFLRGMEGWRYCFFMEIVSNSFIWYLWQSFRVISFWAWDSQLLFNLHLGGLSAGLGLRIWVFRLLWLWKELFFRGQPFKNASHFEFFPLKDEQVSQGCEAVAEFLMLYCIFSSSLWNIQRTAGSRSEWRLKGASQVFGERQAEPVAARFPIFSAISMSLLTAVRLSWRLVV